MKIICFARLFFSTAGTTVYSSFNMHHQLDHMRRQFAQWLGWGFMLYVFSYERDVPICPSQSFSTLEVWHMFPAPPLTSHCLVTF